MQLAEKEAINLFDRKALKEELENSYEIEIAHEGEYQIEVVDDYWGRVVYFNYLDILDIEKLFEFNSLKIDKERFFEKLQKLDKEIFMTIKEIIFINTEEEYDMLYRELEYEYIDMDNCTGVFLFSDSIIVINMMAIRKIAEELCEPYFGAGEIEDINTNIYITLIHELRHAHHENPLFENEFESLTSEEKESDAENYALTEFEEKIIGDMYYIRKDGYYVVY